MASWKLGRMGLYPPGGNSTPSGAYFQYVSLHGDSERITNMVESTIVC